MTLSEAARQAIRRRAYKAVRRALGSGDLVRPEGCEGCGRAVARLHAHHDDYAKPLEVDWLCASCHGNRHRK